MNVPAPKLFNNLPDMSNWKIGATAAAGPAHVVPPAPETPHRSTTQIVPSGAGVTLAVDPHFRPAGRWPRSTPGWYGLGRSLRGPRCDTAGRLTGYCRAGNTGCAPRPVCGGVVGTPHEFACGPADDSAAGDCQAASLISNVSVIATTRASVLIVIVCPELKLTCGAPAEAATMRDGPAE